jgi:hypothetical protein
MDYSFHIGGIMDNIVNALKLIIGLFIYIVFIRIFMEIANFIGEKLRFGKFFMYLWSKIKTK